METDMPKIEPGLPTPAEPDIDPIVAMALEAATPLRTGHSGRELAELEPAENVKSTIPAG
jgi:hypothetical protein